MEFYIVKVGSMYYSWNRKTETMVLRKDSSDAYQYSTEKEARTDIEMMEEHGNYKDRKKKVLKVVCTFKELD